MTAPMDVAENLEVVEGGQIAPQSARSLKLV
jgi:hypothetical protein